MKDGSKFPVLMAFCAIVIVASVVRLTSLAEPGFTCDEITYVKAGINYILYSDFEYNVEHPPLAKYLIGLSVLVFGQTEFGARSLIAILGTLTCVVVFFLARELYDEYTALFSSALLALSTYHIAHSRVATLDAPLTFFYTLTIFFFWKGLKDRKYLWLFGITLGLSIATKYPGVYLYIILAVYLILFEGLISYKNGVISINIKKDLLIAMFLSVGVFILVAPFLFFQFISAADISVPLIAKSIYRNLRHLQAGHSNYFMGEITNTPPPWFYIVYLIYRPTIPMVILFSSGIVYALYRRSKSDVLLLLWIFIPLACFSFQKVKLLHYLVPIFPPLCVLAARGGAGVISSLRIKIKRRICLLAVLILMIWQTLIVYSAHPYYLLYFNELAGGTTGGTRYFTVGWGEGLREAAYYVESHTSPNDKIVSWYSHIVSFYCQRKVLPFPKSLEEIRSNNVKYAIVYLNQLQRYPNNPVIRYLSNLQPEKIIYLRGVPLVWIYKIS